MASLPGGVNWRGYAKGLRDRRFAIRARKFLILRAPESFVGLITEVPAEKYCKPILVRLLGCQREGLVSFHLRRMLGAVGRTVSNLLGRGKPALRLRTKLILSFVLVTTGLTCATLLVVERNAEAQARQEIEHDARNAILTFQVVQRNEQMALSRKADLLASLAYMRNGDATAIEDAGDDPWQSDDCNLFVLADRSGKILALHSRSWAFPQAAAQQMMLRSLSRGETSGWWVGDGNLYQMALQPFYEVASRKKNLLGYVAVGRLIDRRAARDLQRIASTDVVFRSGKEVAISTLASAEEAEFTDQIRDGVAQTQIYLEGQRYYASSLELTPGLYPSVDLIILKSYSQEAAYLQRLNQLLTGLALVAISLGAALIFLISNTITRPLASLVQGVHALEQGDFTHPLESSGHDEISNLTRAFLGMRGTLQRNEEQREQLEGQLRQAQKMDALGRLAGGVAHDFNNLLTVIKGHSELLLDHIKPGDATYIHSEQIRKTADRAASLTRQMLAFSRMQVLQARVLDINNLIVEMGKLLRRLIREEIEFNLQLGNSLGRVKVDPGQFEQVLLNLTVNASDAMPQGGKLSIETRNVVVDESFMRLRPSIEAGKYILIGVTDTGHGMNAATKARVFEPFFTTKEPGKGTGLGLATVYGVVSQSGGFVWVESEPGNGTRFEIYLPRTEEPLACECGETAGNATGCAGRRKTVLVVEDEKEVRELACGFLTAAGYSVLTAEDGLEALETAERLRGSIHAVLTDVVMPKMRGTELGVRLKSLMPLVKIVYMTGYLDQNDGDRGLSEDAIFVQKPFSRETVLHGIGRALENERAGKR